MKVLYELKVVSTQKISLMKRNKTVLLLFFLLITSLGFWSWKKTEKPEIVYLQPVSSPMTMCGSFSALWSDTIKAPPAKILPGLGNSSLPDHHVPQLKHRNFLNKAFAWFMLLIIGRRSRHLRWPLRWILIVPWPIGD